jgi:SAM-dependent methyltransferase
VPPRSPGEGGRLFTFLSESPNARTLDAYEHEAERYRETLGPAPDWHVAFLDRVADAIGPGGAVLELGSGTGDNARYLTGRGLAVQTSDGAGAFVEAMRRDGLSPLLLDVLRDDLGGPWDAVVAFAVLLHLTADELAGVLDQAHTAVRPGGRLALSVKEGDGAAWSDHKLGRPRFFTYWRPEPLARLLGEHGWTVDHLERQTGDRDDWILVIATRR